VPGESVGPDNILDLPPSWVDRLILTPAQVESRCPGRSKHIAYQRGVLHKWAPYAREDGLVSRLTLYSDLQRTVAAHVHETFEQRRDKLLRREIDIVANEVVETFLPGRPFGLHIHELKEGVRRRMHFFPNARLDGLQLREELLGKKTVETYTGRDDRLVYRSVTFDEASATTALATAAAAAAAGASANGGGGAGGGGGGSGSHPGGVDGSLEPAIIKMTEKYARDPAVDAEADVCKRVYNIASGFIRVHYHFGDGRVTASSRVYNKENGTTAVTLVDPFAKKPAESALREDYQALVTAERECLQVRTAASAAAAAAVGGGAAASGASTAACAPAGYMPGLACALLGSAREPACCLLRAICLRAAGGRVKAEHTGSAAFASVHANRSRTPPPIRRPMAWPLAQAFREQERQMKDILTRRKEEEREWTLLVSVYDTARSRQYLDADRKEDAASAAVLHDYLTPFLPNPKSQEPLDRETALKVREACLKSLRVRWAERARERRGRRWRAISAWATRDCAWRVRVFFTSRHTAARYEPAECRPDPCPVSHF
jgi:hypothetical protein